MIISSSSKEKLARAKALGAAHCIDRTATNVGRETLTLTNGLGADHVLELIGGDNFKQSIDLVAVGGRVSVIGLLGAMELSAPTTPILLKTPVIQGIATGHRRAIRFVRAVDHIGLKPVVDHRYSFKDLQIALDHLKAGAFGKIVIDLPNVGAFHPC